MSPIDRSRDARPPLSDQERRNRKIGITVALVFFGMVGAAYAAVPFYKAFCEATGYDGTVRRAYQAPDKVLDKQILVHFDANVNGLPWDFEAEQHTQPLKIGETKVALFKVTNNSDRAVTGRAVFNVVPEQTAVYFHKLSCFCFSDQTIGPHKTVEMPVLYFVDPKYATDFETKGEREVTLSYTFYPAADARPAPAAANGAR
jgi:cytochrome c oxidase assembly protein subunit 11